METTWQEKIQKFADKIQSNKYLSSISKGLMAIIPVILVGSIFTLLENFEVEAYQNFLTSSGLDDILSVPYQMTMELFALYAVVSIAYMAAGQFNKSGFPVALIALMSFLIVTPAVEMEVSDGETAWFLSYEWLGAEGLFVAIIVALLSARVYALIMDKNFYIKMPKGVPPTIEKSFAAIAPAFIIIIFWLIVSAIYGVTDFETFHNFIYTLVQEPLTALGGQWWAYLIVVFVAHFLWIFGIHGTIVALSVMLPIWTPMGIDNLSAYQAGEPLPHMVPGRQFFLTYTALGGSGATIGFMILMLRSKSERLKKLGKLAFIPGATNINEPIIFGTPIVMNPKLAIPFITAPLATSVLAMIATSIGLVEPLRGVNAPLGTPIFMNGWLEGGLPVAILQAVLLVVTIVIYFPFFKMLEKDAVKLEQESQAE